MNIPWPHRRCIVCLQETPLSREHLIPSALGGQLTADLLCRQCNSRIGQRIESAARTDPTIRLLERGLAAQMPALARKLADDQDYLLSGPGGQARGYSVAEEYVVHARRLEDGSLIQPTPQARMSIDTMLRRKGFDAPFREDAIRRLDDAPENVRVVIAEDLSVTKWTIAQVQLDLRAPLMNPVVPVKIAYEFLAGHLGQMIYEEIPPLTAARRILAGEEPDTARIAVERLEAPQARPFHGIVFEGNTPHASVQVRLFGQLTFRVRFAQLAVGGSRAELVRRARRAYAARGVGPAKKAALTRDPLEAMLATCTDGLIGLRDRTLLLFAFSSGGRRRSEVAAATMENLTKVDEDTYLYHLTHSKTDQAGADHNPHAAKPITGPAAHALRAWLEASGITTGAIFRRIRKTRAVEPLSARPCGTS